MNTNKKLPPTPLSLSLSSTVRSTKIEITQVAPPVSEDTSLNIKTLKRKNFKKLQLSNDSFSIPENKDTYKEDPELNNSTDQLISQFTNLELGLEFQLDLKDKDLLTLKKLGSGNSGTVYKVLHLPTQKTMAKKSIHIETKSAVQVQIIRELRIMHDCNSNYIIEFYGAFLSNNNVIICMEYLNCGSLDRILKLNGPLPIVVISKVTSDVLNGLTYLYDVHKIIHRDVKPSNVLMNHKGQFKLCDFGVSRELANSLADTFVGTSTYMSPERIQGGVYSIKSDVWSLGLMLVELASGEFPFGDNQSPEGILDLLQRIVNEKPPSLDRSKYDVRLCEFVDSCLVKVDKRLNPWELLEHDLIKGDEKLVKVWAKKIRKLQKEK